LSLTNASEVMATIRDLIVHLHRGNEAQAESIVTELSQHLKSVMLNGGDPASPMVRQAQQTLFAIDETRMLLAQRDFAGATAAARDAAKEWKPAQNQTRNMW
jgi:hypothetical protein